MEDTQPKKKVTHLLVLKSRRELIFHETHKNPIARHLGQGKTLIHLMTHFIGEHLFTGGVQHVTDVSW